MQGNPLPRESLPSGSVVCYLGESGDAAYIIEAGSVEVITAHEQRVAILRAGELFGEIALLDDKPRTATVRTLEPTILLRVERAHVQQLLKRTDPVIRYLLTLLLERFRSHRLAPIIMAELVGHLPLHDEATATRTLMLAHDLAYALENEQLDLAYQPLIDFAERKLIGFEALIRWQHPTWGAIRPCDLIELAEKTGLIHPLGAWVLRNALADWSSLREHCQGACGLSPFISVNLSASELADPHIVDTIRDCLAATGMNARELKVELTETDIIEDRKLVVDVLEKLATLGVEIALDDFGTGYAGLDYLKALPISCLKIDQSFIQEMKTSTRSLEIVQSAINLAKSMGLSTVGEGIEDMETARLLDEMGCQVAQGYYFARPMAKHAIPDWLREAKAQGLLSGA